MGQGSLRPTQELINTRYMKGVEENGTWMSLLTLKGKGKTGVGKN